MPMASSLFHFFISLIVCCLPLFHRLFYFISFLSAFTNFLILSRLILFLISILLIVMRRMVRTVGIEITVRPAPYNHISLIFHCPSGTLHSFVCSWSNVIWEEPSSDGTKEIITFIFRWFMLNFSIFFVNSSGNWAPFLLFLSFSIGAHVFNI